MDRPQGQEQQTLGTMESEEETEERQTDPKGHHQANQYTQHGSFERRKKQSI